MIASEKLCTVPISTLVSSFEEVPPLFLFFIDAA